MSNRPTLATIREAGKRIARHAHCTPIFTCQSLNEMSGAKLYFKCENFQKVGAFKFRGACNAVLSLPDIEAERGVVTHSSGNHAQALALAARVRGIRARIVMPRSAPGVKIAAVEGYGAEITFCEPTLQAREGAAKEIIEETGAVLIHPYDDYRIIAGQGTAALELMTQVPQLDAVVAPVGGGGLLSGTAIAVKGLNTQTKVVAAEPEQADDAYRSFRAGHIIPADNPETIADGLKTSLGELTFPIIRDLVDGIETVSEEAIGTAMRHIWERMKLVVEPSGAVPLAMLLGNGHELAGKRVGVILSGGNVDLAKLPFRS